MGQKSWPPFIEGTKGGSRAVVRKTAAVR